MRLFKLLVNVVYRQFQTSVSATNKITKLLLALCLCYCVQRFDCQTHVFQGSHASKNTKKTNTSFLFL